VHLHFRFFLIFVFSALEVFEEITEILPQSEGEPIRSSVILCQRRRALALEWRKEQVLVLLPSSRTVPGGSTTTSV
jgi:hypothetical protein